jgi:hypothetical protein
VRHVFTPVFALLFAACGAPAMHDLHAAFASIQVDEARIEHASIALETAGGDDERAPLVTEICDAADHIDATATPLEDRDAAARSARANATCTAARERAP